MEHPTFSSLYWEDRYSKGETGWDMKGPAPWLLPATKLFPDTSARILIPGCGNGHEVLQLLSLGYKKITALDFSESACRKLSASLPAETAYSVLCEDFFAHRGTYDVVLEQTFFCSFHPSRRPGYVSHMHSLLSSNGLLMGVLFASDFSTAGPPFGGRREDYMSLFQTRFSRVEMELCTSSHPARSGNELLFVCEK